MLVLNAANLNNARIAHGFFGRTGGVSTGIFASLNCGPGSGDDRALVIENRKRAAEKLSASASLLTVHQIHSANVVTVRDGWEMGHGAQADAMVTDKPGLALGILTADCAPVLFADTQAGVIGAAHAGWKGAVSGVTDCTIAAMETLGAKRTNIAASIGPCISQANYEVGPDFRERFLEAAPANTSFFTPSDKAEHWRFDLEEYVVHRLRHAGIENIAPLSACTYAREADFFSYRRATHRREPNYGRQVSAILLK
ncbi:MAG TPA: peptidoglycan editing factor PgeF [Rhizomicrobium sp.]|jgi:hypothetical protein|nr:peptidoglycan editing factor PgeF [Rhizomicrobium sp.]